MKKNSSNKGFTIAELLTVAAILSILGTIGFISFTGYTQNARDTVRKSDVNSIEEVMELYYVTEQKYPPVTAGFDVVYDGFPLWTQGVFGVETQVATGKIFGDLKDPRYGNHYAYSTTQSEQEYQLGVVYERTTIGRDDWRFTQNLIPQSYAQASDNPIINLPTDNPAVFNSGLQAWYDASDVDADGLDDSSDQFIGNVGVVNDVSTTSFTPFYFDRVIWLDAQDIRGNEVPYTDGADVLTWRNKTGAGFDAFVPQTGNNHSSPAFSSAPNYTATGFNGNPGVEFNGVSKGDRIVVDRGGQPKGDAFSLAYTFSINDNANTAHATIISAGPTGGGEYFSRAGGWQLSRDNRNNQFVFRINGTIVDRTYFDEDGNIDTRSDSSICSTCGTSGGDAEVTFGTWDEVNNNEIHTVFLTYEGNIVTGYLDGTKRFEAQYTSATQPFGEYFRFFGNRAGTEYLEGTLGEVFIAGEKISLQDIERIEGYFAHRWDWIDDLPAGHPFKSNPPQMDSFSQIDYTRYSGIGTIPDSFDSNAFYNSNPDILNTETARYPGSMPGVNIAENNKVHIWRGPIKVSEAGEYTFSLTANDYGFIKINGDTVVDSGATAIGGVQSGSIFLEKDVSYDFEMIFGVDDNFLPSLGSARNVTDGYYSFDIGGEQFSTYVENGWILVASGRGVTGESSYPQVSNLTLQSDRILSDDIFSELTDATEVRMSASDTSSFDVTSTNSIVLNRLTDFKVLGHLGSDDADWWSGIGDAHLEIICNASEVALSAKRYHACGNTNGTHWEGNNEKIRFNGGSTDLNLWVRADVIEDEVLGNLEYRVQGPGVIGYRKYTAFGWDDKSVNNNDLSQITPEFQPSFNAGNRSFEFQNEAYFEFTNNPIGATDNIEMFVVWEAEETGRVEDLDGYVFENTFGNPGSLQFGAGGMRAGSDEILSNSVIGKQTQLSSYKVGQAGSGLMEYFLGGQNYAVSETNVGAYDTPFYIGDKNGGLKARVKEILIYNQHLDRNEREQIEGYLSHKWGIQNKLPGLHPYYDSLQSDDESFVELTGNYNGILVHSSLGDSHIVVVSPSIMSSLSSSTTLDIKTVMGENRLVYNGYLNTPASYVGITDSSEKIVDKDGFFFDVAQPKIFEGSRHELANFDGISQIDESVRLVYTNSRIYEDISGHLENQNSDYVKDILGNVIGINPITPFYCKDILDKSFGSNVGLVANVFGSSGESVSGGIETINDGDTSSGESYSYRTNPGEDPEITIEWDDIYDIGFIRLYNGFGDISQNLWSATMSVFDENDIQTYEYIFGNTLGVGTIDITIPPTIADMGVKKIVITPISDYDAIALREIEVFIGQNLQSGIYKVDSDGIGGQASYNVFCDMVTDGGGWTKVGENFIDRGNFQGFTDPGSFSGYFASGDINNASENTIRSDIALPGDLTNAGVLRHSGDENSYYELNFSDLPDIEFTSEIRLGAWVKGTTDSPFFYGLTYQGEGERNFHASSDVLNPNIWRYETLRIPLSDTLETFTWKIGRGIDATTPLDITGLSVELFYK